MNEGVVEKKGVSNKSNVGSNESIGNDALTPGLLILFIVFAAVIILKSAWVGDDAYISFRTVYNFTHGYGLTFNINERVQSFTNPLWVLLMSAFYFFTEEAYFTSIFLSLAIALGSVYMLAWKANWEKSMSKGIWILLLITCSKAFIDYSTSGLETVLSVFLTLYFYHIYFSEPRTPGRLLLLTLLASLAAVNRLDNVLVFALPLFGELYLLRSLRAFWLFILGGLPLILWELFSLVYYGFPFPNTYYAKLNTSIPAWETAKQGLLYLVNSLSLDPLTLLTITFAIAMIFLRWPGRRFLVLASSILIHIFYTVKVGGDFMSGRFLVLPFALSVFAIAALPLAKVMSWVGAGAVLLMAITNPLNPIVSDSFYDENKQAISGNSGVVDERRWYYPVTGFLKLNSELSVLDHERLLNQLQVKGDSITDFVVCPITLGFESYGLGPNIYVMNFMGLPDVLLSRLPMNRYYAESWRTGHIFRRIPQGYEETLRKDDNVLRDKSLAEFYDKINIIIREGVWSVNRFVTIAKMNLGLYDHLIDSPYYALPSKSYGVFEMDRRIGKVVADPDATSGQAVMAEELSSEVHNAVAFGPYESLAPGKYEALFRIKFDGDLEDGPQAVIDAFSEGFVIERFEITKADIKEKGKYYDYLLSFELDEDRTGIEFRIIKTSNSILYADIIEVNRLKE